MNFFNSLNNKESFNSFNKFFFLWCILIIIIKNENLFISPRFWAEEGTIYFKFAKENSFLSTLFAPHLDYYSLIPNLSTAISAHFFPLKYAPLITTIFALICQTIPVGIIVFGKFVLWRSPLQKIIMSLVAITIAEPEIWLNTINSQFFLGLATILIFFESDFTKNKIQIVHSLILIISGLTGPISSFFFPLFLYKYKVEKTKNIKTYTVILFLTSTLQFTLFVYFFIFSEGEKVRLMVDNIDNLLNGFFSHFFGIFKFISFNDRKNIGVAVFVFFIYLVIVSKNKICKSIIVAFLFVSLLSLVGSLKMETGSRYAYIPTFLLLSLIYSEVITDLNNIKNFRYRASLLIFVLSLTSYIFFYRYDRSSQFLGPNWKKEVEKRDVDKNYALKIYPIGWEFKLK